MVSTLRKATENLPPGFGFYPRDDELINHYLRIKVSGSGDNFDGAPMMVEVDLNGYEPWELPDEALVGGKEWYFYYRRCRKYMIGLRVNRSTKLGYWKSTGKDRRVIDPRTKTLVGMRKTLVFHEGRAPKGINTEWTMHEFRLEGPSSHSPEFSSKENWVLCRVFSKVKDGTSQSRLEENINDDNFWASLPPLLDLSPTFGLPLPNPEVIEHLPCFSNFSLNHSSQQPTPSFSQLPPLESNMPIIENTASCEDILDLGTCLNPSSSSIYDFTREKTVTDVDLDCFANFEGNMHVAFI